jgi:small subunit ribosomal protein S6
VCRGVGNDIQILLLHRVGAFRQGGCPKEEIEMRSYELMVIHRYDMDEADVRAAVEEVEKAITARDGVVTGTDFWGKRRFAYEIDHMTEGYYSVLTFDGDVELQTTLDRSLGLLDSVVRHKIMRPTH